MKYIRLVSVLVIVLICFFLCIDLSDGILDSKNKAIRRFTKVNVFRKSLEFDLFSISLLSDCINQDPSMTFLQEKYPERENNINAFHI